MSKYLLICFAVFPYLIIQKEQAATSKEEMLKKVNEIRAKGCYCGRRWIDPVPPLKWNDKLYKSAQSYAEELYKFKYFDHTSREGKDIGQRLDDFKYKWQFAGENLGEGQTSFNEVLEDWMKSRSHCRMLMNDNMKEMAIASYKTYWVQHFGAQLPDGTERKNVKLIEGQ